MKYRIEEGRIVIHDLENFNAKHILECGQIFTYEKVSQNEYIVFSKDKMCSVVTHYDYAEIITRDTHYFKDFFDLETDYQTIKSQILSLIPQGQEMLEFGKGIRILNQDVLETIIGFIISANNNISRITASMKFLREKAGEKVNGFYAFPTLEKLKTYDEDFFISAGLGYRARQIVKAIKQLSQLNLEELKLETTLNLRKTLMQVQGIGAKVADCILLFAYGKRDVFPVDTWIEKIYNELFDKDEKNRGKMRDFLVNKFGDLSGYAQQYMFYFKRSSR